ncbi:class I SAM-dependent methyltransferase [Tessaracoccus sp. OH4464_COT-324]|uniref:class I SAM-dependent methyltransferase n=1 Tax=Tessaracoccus sp. OH4464_COT-324 TaxID=2491059 RepID=UPI000F63CDCF|nr:methyltransferase domain-containing protein [Tessaracoccus sp. OH4464_COT-324]RRD46698.1 methyltransferase domain-containing protein [Tessaracoccus sp. OH4464_COT-324]
MSDGQLRWLLAQRPGALEALLARSLGGAQSPFDWLARVVSASAKRVLVVACGSGGLVKRLQARGRIVVGLDWSESSLNAARSGGSEVLVRADANHLPFADDVFDTVLTDVGLAVNENRDVMLREIARVLRVGGMFAGLTPSHRPLSAGDLKVVAPLTVLLRRMPHVPGESEFRARKLLEAAGLTKAEDSRARFHFTVRDADDAELLLAGLRAADDPSRARKAVEYLTDAARTQPVEFPLPFRRVLALK